MKRNLLTASMLFVGMTATYAQLPDASSWKVGDEITDQIGWGNLDFTSPDFTPWQLESTKGSFTKNAGLFEVYDGADVDLYQYVQLPAGKYKMEAQAYYRFGNSWAEDPDRWNAGEWEPLAQMYVSNGTYSIDDNKFTVNRTFQTPVMPRLFDTSDTQVYVDEVKEGWDKSDNTITIGGNTVYAPASVEGSLAYFNLGKFAPYDDGSGTKYNTVSFFLPTDGYVRVGITKKEAKEADSFMATNFKMYYEGQAGPAEELMMLQDDVKKLLNDIETLGNKYEGLFCTLCSDFVIDYDGDPDSMNKEECIAAKKELGDFYQSALRASEFISKLKDVLPSMKALAAKGYPGKDAFEAAIAEAENCIDPNYQSQADDTLENFEKAYNGLLNARMPYLLSQEKVNGAIDMTAAIAYPWFCLPEYEPVWNAEEKKWEPNQTVLTMVGKTETNDSGEVNEKTWDQLDDTNGTADNIAKGISVTNALGTPNAWAQGGSGGNLEVYWNDKLTCIKKWAMPFEGLHEVSQVVTNVPNGWYSLTALGQTWTNDWAGNCNCHIFIQSGDMKDESTPVEIGGWWGTNIDQWKNMSTGMIQVTDNQVKIGSLDNGFWAVTGFQLKYYGETPDFTILLAEDINKVNASADELLWMGDKNAVKAILAEIPAEVTTEEAFLNAKLSIKKANDYITEAKAVTSNFKPADKYYNLAEAYEEGTPEYDIIINAWTSVMSMEEDEDAGIYLTYKDAIEANEIYDAYASYINYRASIGDYIKKPDVAKVVAEQNDILTKKYASVEELSKYQSDIALVYNKVLLADKNIDLSKATEDNPVDVTLFVANPGFEEGKTGWTGDMTNDKISGSETLYFGVPERYNTTFDINQTLHSLPAGYYRVKCQAFYRDGGDANQAYKNWQTAGYDKELWDTGIAYLYANDRQVKVNSLGSEYPTEYMTEYIEKYENAEEGIEGTPVYKKQDVENPSFAFPWDTKVTDGEETFYYPNSVYGSKNIFTKHPEMYNNEIDVYVEEGGNLTFGLRKTEKIGNDWSMFDNFQLFYIGTKTPTGINATEIANGANAEGIYTISGVKTNSMNKGINIIKMSDGTVKKVVK